MASDHSIDLDRLHHDVALKLASDGQRYTSGRRQIIECLAHAPRPMGVAQLLGEVPEVPQSSAYRSLAVMTQLGITRRIAGADENGYYELSEELAGSHHHHALCESCGRVVDIASNSKLEKALAEAARIASEQTGFILDAHRMDLVGTCGDCVDKRD
jgi:Fur family peroxide stress response transcriptional regulator